MEEEEEEERDPRRCGRPEGEGGDNAAAEAS